MKAKESRSPEIHMFFSITPLKAGLVTCFHQMDWIELKVCESQDYVAESLAVVTSDFPGSLALVETRCSAISSLKQLYAGDHVAENKSSCQNHQACCQKLYKWAITLVGPESSVKYSDDHSPIWNLTWS